MDPSFLRVLYEAHRDRAEVPSPAAVCRVIDGLLAVMFPELSDREFTTLRELEAQVNDIRLDLYQILTAMESRLPASAEEVEGAFLNQLPQIREWLLLDAAAISEGDPAATGATEVIRSYPGFFAIAVYRLAHALYQLQVPLIPRILAEHAHSKTGIDIHPHASIGKRFCIDHGTGVVIGETVVIGEEVKIYQGVTLGALSVRKDMAQTKRHPTIEDRVVIYSGATILGGDTVIGHDSIIGGNTWITRSVEPGSVVYGK